MHRTCRLKPTRLSVHYSSATDLWGTPPAFYRLLYSEFRFTLDVCAIPANAKCERFFSPEEDGLAQPWSGACFMTPVREDDWALGGEDVRRVALRRGRLPPPGENRHRVVALVPHARPNSDSSTAG